jgi:hypothetical protein
VVSIRRKFINDDCVDVSSLPKVSSNDPNSFMVNDVNVCVDLELLESLFLVAIQNLNLQMRKFSNTSFSHTVVRVESGATTSSLRT